MLSNPIPAQRPFDDGGLRALRHQLPQQVVDQIDCGLLVCDAKGRMAHANRAALREFASARVLTIEGGILCCRGPSANDLSAAIKAAAVRGLRRLVYLQDNPPLMLVVMPLDPVPDSEPMVLVMIGRRSLCTPLGLELLAVQHRLTWAEQRVLRALVRGIAVRDIATDHGVAVSTVRTQVQSIRDKLGVANIDALLLVAARIPPVPSCH